MKIDIPILVIAFNKTRTTNQVLNQLEKFNARNIYFSIDGARNEKEKDTVDLVKDRILRYKHFTNTRLNCEKQNLGCRKHVIKAINSFFANEEFGIILEDDTLPSRQFFEFCNVLLKRYKDDKSIWHIGGYKPPNISETQYAYTYTKATHVWGWATWANRWKHYKEDISETNINLIKEFTYFDSSWKTKKRVKQLRAVCRRDIDTWDFNWNATVRLNNGLAIRPNLNLVQNIGLGDPNATNTSRIKRAYTGKITEQSDMNGYTAPPFKLPIRKLERQFEWQL